MLTTPFFNPEANWRMRRKSLMVRVLESVGMFLRVRMRRQTMSIKVFDSFGENADVMRTCSSKHWDESHEGFRDNACKLDL
jgi:hypothetical protein